MGKPNPIHVPNFIRGGMRGVYIRAMSDAPPHLGGDPTMCYVQDDLIEEAIVSISMGSSRPPDEIERNCYGNPKIVLLKWFYHPEYAPPRIGLDINA